MSTAGGEAADTVVTVAVDSLSLASVLRPLSSHRRLPTRVSKYGAISLVSWPAVNMLFLILLRYASTIEVS